MIDIQEKYTNQTHIEVPLVKSNTLSTPKAQAKAEQKLKKRVYRKQCSSCRKVSTTSSRCSRCKEAYYCSRTCQAKDWMVHKGLCNQIMGRKGESGKGSNTETLPMDSSIKFGNGGYGD